MEEQKETVVVTPSGRVTTETAENMEGVQFVEDTGDLPVVKTDELDVVYDDVVPGGEINPELLEQYYAMAQKEAAMRQMMRPRRYVPKSIHTKSHQTKEKRAARNKLQKKSRKKNRKKK